MLKFHDLFENAFLVMGAHEQSSNFEYPLQCPGALNIFNTHLTPQSSVS